MPNPGLARSLICLMALAGWMLAAQPYRGLWHDGILYFGQVLMHSRVPALAEDIFFASGSQDRYSIYAHIVAPLYALLGEYPTHVAGVLLGWCASAGALWALLAQLGPQRLAAWGGLLAFGVVAPIYGGGWVFGYGEPFLTARTAAEPLLLWSLVALLRQRLGLVAALQMAAMLFHPLMSLPVAVATGCFLVQCDRRWLWALVALPMALLAGAAGVPPFDGLFKRYDPYWWSLISTVNAQVLLQNWSLLDWLTLALDLALLMGAARLCQQAAIARLLHAVVATNLLLFTLSILLADGLQLVLATQLQLWRAHWIAHLLAVALAPWLALRLWARGGLWPVSVCALALAMLNVHIGGPHGLATMGLLVFTLLLASRVGSVSAPMRWLVGGAILLAAAVLAVARLHGVLTQQALQNPAAGLGASLMLVLGFPAVAMPGFLGLWWLSARGRAGLALAGMASAGLLLFAALNWVQRPDLARAVESRASTPHPFAAHLPPKASVYWPTQLLPVWGLLERSSHYAPQQGAGMLFHRNTAMAFGARRELYRGINEDYVRCRNSAMLFIDREALTSCDMPAQSRLATLCRAWEAPDAVVLPQRIGGLSPLASWEPPARHDPPQTFMLYSCRQLATLPD